MDLCHWWGRDLSWWHGLSRDDRVRYLAHWNLRNEGDK